MTFMPAEVTVYEDKTAAPTVNDDQNDGYEIGDLWVDETNDTYYVCVDITAGAAVWIPVTVSHTHDDRYYTETEVDDLLSALASALPDLTDVTITGPADLDLLQYDNTSSKWVDRTFAEAGIAAAAHAHDDRYYTETELDAGQLDNRYYTETEVGTWRNSVTQTEMGYLHGIGSDIQTQLDARCLESVLGTSIGAGLLLDGTILETSVILQKYHAIDPSADVQSVLGCANEAAIRTFLDLEAGTDFYSKSAEDTWRNSVTQTEMGYLDGVTSDIQTQLNGKEAAGISVLENDFAATSFLYALADNTPLPKTPAEVMAILSGEAGAAFSFNSQNLTGLGTLASVAGTLTIDETASLSDYATNAEFDSHHDRHDPQDGADALDCATAAEISVVVAAGEGSAHSFARSDHVHAVNHAITDNHLVTIDGTSNQPVNLDYAKFTASGLEGRSYAQVLSDIGAEAAGISVLESDFNADTFLYATNDNTPVATSPANVLAALSGHAAAAFAFNSQNLTGVGTIGCGTITTTGDYLLANGNYVGISAAERLEFYTAGYAAFIGCDLGVGILVPQTKVDIRPPARGTAYSAADLTTWSDVHVHNPTDTANAATGISFSVYSAYHVNAGAGIGAVKQANTAELDLVFITRPTGAVAAERMRITSEGKVGIRTNNPNQELTIEGTMSLKEQANANADTAAYGQLWVKTATPNQLWFTDDAGNDCRVPNDYQEGTYTITVTPNTSGSVTLDIDTMAYTKIGRLVSVQGYITISSISSPVGDLRFSLPFTSADLAGAAGISPGTVAVNGLDFAGNYLTMCLLEGHAYFTIRQTTDNAGWTTLKGPALGGSEIFMFQLTYIAA